MEEKEIRRQWLQTSWFSATWGKDLDKIFFLGLHMPVFINNWIPHTNRKSMVYIIIENHLAVVL